MKLNKFSINIDWLKIIALILMTIDHIAKIFPSVYFSDFLQCLGAVGFPIFCFILMYHLQRKQIYIKYLIRLGIFSFLTFLGLAGLKATGVNVARVPFNILYMFFVCVLALALKKFAENKIKNNLFKSFVICLIYVFGGVLVYRLSVFAFVYVVLIYCLFEKPTKVNGVMLLFFAFLVYLGGFLGVICVITTALLMNVDYDKKHQRIIKKWYVFYWYYPLHLVVLLLLAMYW